MPRNTDFCICMYVFGCKLSLFRLCDSDFGISPVDGITVGITCTAFCFHKAHISFASSWYFVLFVGYCFGEIMCVRDRCVYQKGVLCLLIQEIYVRSVRRYCFVRNYVAVQYSLKLSFSSTLAGAYLQYELLSTINSAASASFW